MDTAECEKMIDLLRTGRCLGCGGLVREQIKGPEDVDELLYERDPQGGLIGLRCPKCAKYVQTIIRERYF